MAIWLPRDLRQNHDTPGRRIKESSTWDAGSISVFSLPRSSAPLLWMQEGYKRIEDLLRHRGYRQGGQPFIFFRSVKVGDKEINVEVNLLAGEYEGTSKSHRHQKIQGIGARKVRGCDLVFEMPKEIKIEGRLPNGAHDTVTVHVSSIVPFFVMKGMAMEARIKEKDAWDIYYCMLNYPGGIDALAEEFKPHLHHGLVREGLQKIAGKFSSEKDFGPRSVALRGDRRS